MTILKYDQAEIDAMLKAFSKFEEAFDKAKEKGMPHHTDAGPHYERLTRKLLKILRTEPIDHEQIHYLLAAINKIKR